MSEEHTEAFSSANMPLTAEVTALLAMPIYFNLVSVFRNRLRPLIFSITNSNVTNAVVIQFVAASLRKLTA